MAPPFALRIDAAERRLTIVVRGLWDMATVAAFGAAHEAAFARYRAGGGGHGSLLTLVDARTAAVHPREVSEEIQRIARRYMPFSRRTATVVSESVIQMLQSRRIAASATASRIFTDPREAQAWLDEALSPATAPSADRRVPAPPLA